MAITLSRTWHLIPNPGSLIKVEYNRGNAYPVVHNFSMVMPQSYFDDAIDGDPLFPTTVVPLLSGFDVNYRNAAGDPAERPLRQIRVDLQTDGWNSGAGTDGPRLRAIIGLRDNSGNPPDDPFVAWLHVSAIVTFDYTVDTGRVVQAPNN